MLCSTVKVAIWLYIPVGTTPLPGEMGVGYDACGEAEKPVCIMGSSIKRMRFGRLAVGFSWNWTKRGTSSASCSMNPDVWCGMAGT